MTDVRWMRPSNSKVPHAFEVDQLAVPFSLIWPLSRVCGPFQVDGLIEDTQSERCRLCQRAVAELEGRTSS